MKGTTEKFTIVGDLQLSVQNALGGINQLQDKLSKLKLPQQNQQELTGAYKKLQNEAQNYINIVSKGFKTKADKKELERSFGNIKKYINEWNTAFDNIDTSALKSAFDELNGGEIKKTINLIAELEKQLNSIGEESSKSIKQQFNQIKENIGSSLKDSLEKGLNPDVYKDKVKELNKIFNSTANTLANNVGKGRFDLVDENLTKLQTRIKELFQGTGKENEIEGIINRIAEATRNVDTEGIKQLVASLGDAKNQLGDLQTKNLEQAKDILKQVPDVSREAAQGIGEIHEEEKKAADGAIQLNSEMDHLKSRITYFFGLANGVQLFRRALRDAINTTKELDAVMTQTAVVSKNTVADMWKTLPEYSKEAKKLGAAIKDVYSAQTLYVQQGLEMNQAMDLGVETLKMARVAGIDAAEATNSMTAALRGFNMELTETSALRVNDVYSKLAQNTASNVQEISTAMTKTAALANSANMSFENTAAFLATIIESTREGAETAGTALKTVIARFTEVKKLYSEGELTGTDEEGQEVDVNKISAALRTAGINMNDFFTGAKGLDEIFMELGSKWDSLTTVQQRYIATMAAGSRQQSRFLALMQNYSRTVELTTMAYNSAGSGQEQFEKTLDSLEAKINQFKAAWDSFVMGIANSDVIKWFIDAGTKILETINKIIDAISGGNGLVKSISSIAAAVGVFKAGKGLAGLLIGGTSGKGGILGSIIGKVFGSKEVGEKAAKGFLGSFSNAIKVGAGKNFLSGVLKNNFSLYSKAASKIDTSQFQVDLMDTTSNIDFDQYKDSLYAWQDNVAKFGANSKEAASSLTILEKDFKAAGGSGEEFSKILQQNSTELSSFKVNMNGVANVAGIAGAALLGLGSKLEGLGGNWEYVGKVVKAFGAGLLAFTGVYKIVTAATKAFGIEMEATIAGIPIIGWIAIVISALTTLSITLASVIETSSEKFERLSTGFEQAAEEAKKAKKDYENLLSSIKEIDKAENVLDDLITGTEEWDTAVQNLNQSILELISLYPELAGAITYVNDHLHLDVESDIYKKYIEDQKQAATDAIYAESASKIGIAEAGLEKEPQYNFLGSKEQSLVRLLETGSLYEAMLARVNSDDLYAEQYSSNFYSIDKEAWDLLQKAITDGLLDFSGSLTNATSQLDAFLRNNNFEYDWNTVDDIRGLLTSSGLGFQYFTKLSNILRGLPDFDSIKTTNLVSARTKIASDFSNTLGSTLAFNMSKELFDKYYNPNIEITLADKTAYANAIGGKVNGKDVYTKEGTKVTEGTQYFVAAKKAENDTARELTNFYKDIYSKWNLDQQEVFTALFNEGKTLTIQQLRDLNDSKYDKVIAESIKYGGFNREQINKRYAEYEKSFNGIKIDSNLGKWLENFVDNIGQLDSLSRSLTIIKDKDSFTEIFDNLDNLSEDAKNLIATTDFTKAENIRNLTKSLEELGVAVGPNFTNRLIAATGAVYTYSAATVKSSVEALEGARSSYEKMLEGQRKFTEEEYAQFAQLEGFDRSQWIKSGSNEYTYLGETNSILSSIESMVAKLTKEEPEQLGARIEEANILSQNIEELNKKEIGRNRTLTFSMKDAETGKNIQTNASDFATAILSASDNSLFSDATMGSFAKELNIEIGDATGKQLFAILQAALADYGNVEGLKQQLAILQNERSAIALQSLSGQAILNNEYDQETFKGRTTKDLLNAKLEIGDKENVEYLKRVLNLSEDYDDALKALMADSKTTQKNFDNLTKVYKENADALTEEGKKTGKYGAALGQLTAAAKAAFGNNEKITDKFVEAHLNDFKAMAEGSEEALETIRQELLNTSSGIDIVDKAVEQISGADFSITGTADVSDIINNLNLTKKEAEAAQKRLNELGYTAELKIVGYKYNSLTGKKDLPVYQLVATDTAGNAVRETKTGGGGGGGGKSKDFENDFDKYYNMVEDINELQRLRNLLETDYNQLLESEAASGKAIYDNLKRQIQLLRERRDITADLAEKRKQQIIDETQKSENADLAQYAWWNETDLTIEIDWDKINAVKDSELGDRIKDFVSTLEGFQSKYDEQIEALEDIESTLQEIEKRGRDQYTSLEDRVRDALIKRIQDQIDELTAVDEAINDANQKLFDSISQTLELQRQERDNAKTEEELANKEQRLAYLQQDSSGANDVEIARLQQELADAREDYTDTLIDQKISELQRQNDEAAQQRQEQISLMQQSLDWQEKSGEFWQQAYEIMSQGVDEQGQLVHQSELETLLKQGEAWTSLSDEGKMNWLSELETLVAQATAYLAMSRQLEDIGVEAGKQITFTNNEGQTLKGVVDKNGNVVVTNADGSTTTYKDVFQDYNGAYRTFETEGETKTAQKPVTSTTTPTTPTSTNTDTGTGKNWAVWRNSAGHYDVYWYPNQGKYATKAEAQAVADRLNGVDTTPTTSVGGGGGGSKNVMRHYATGGMNYQTGPAWLDGTPSRPEAVLNARDTENFIQLRDTLADLRKASGNGEIRGGDNYFEIDINVDKIDSDYDVDRMAERLKTLIYQDGAYRNVNTLSRLR